MSSPGEQLSITVRRAAERSRRIPDGEAATPRAPGKWSPKEIIGHLIDPASNNHQRFVRAQLSNDLRFQGYAQDDRVRVQHYAEADRHALIALWEAINLHMAWVMDHTPEEVRSRERADHNMQEVALRTLPEGRPVTLDWFMHDYVQHLKHHLRQIDQGLVRN